MATPDQIRKKVRSYTWERWLERPYGTFLLSLFAGVNSRFAMRRFGVDAEYKSFLFQDGWWYESPDVTVPYAEELKRFLVRGGSIARIVRACEVQYKKGLATIKKANTATIPIKKKLIVLRDAEANVVPFIWFAHGFEDVLTEMLEARVPEYIHGDVSKYIGDISLPTKKTAASLMEDAMRRGIDPKQIVEKFGWIKARDGFSEPFTVDEVRLEQKKLVGRPMPHHRMPAIPAPLRSLVRDAQGIVYLRTLRTDAIFEMMYRARPLLKEAATSFGMPFNKLADYSIHDLIAGKPVRHPTTIIASAGSSFSFFDSYLIDWTTKKTSEIRGTIAFAGTIRGTARIVKSALESDKVKKGDILVAPMTFPSLIMAMQRAAAFVTDEGGLTCHAAIVAREMHKPCIVGTKHATQVLKDGDMVEVDAERGIVKKL